MSLIVQILLFHYKWPRVARNGRASQNTTTSKTACVACHETTKQQEVRYAHRWVVDTPLPHIFRLPQRIFYSHIMPIILYTVKESFIEIWSLKIFSSSRIRNLIKSKSLILALPLFSTRTRNSMKNLVRHTTSRQRCLPRTMDLNAIFGVVV